MNKGIYKIFVIILMLSLSLLLLLGAKSCIGRNNRKARVGSSDIPVFMLNAPLNLSATAVSSSQINLSWQDNSNNEDGFQVERSTNPATGYSLLATVGANVTIYSDTSVTSANTYYYRIRAFNIVGDYSDFSNISNAYTFDWAWIPTSWKSIAAGPSHSLALESNGNLWSWGLNEYGQLGLGNWTNSPFPTRIIWDLNYNLFSDITSVMANMEDFGYTIALKTDGTSWGWGANGVGQLGIGYTDTPLAPDQRGSDSDWFVISVGGVHSLGIKTTGTLWAWGGNSSGQLGLGDIGLATYRTTPTQVTSETDWSILAAGGYYSLGLKMTGTLWAWGGNNSGQLGIGDLTGRNSPTQVGTESDWSTLIAGDGHNFSLKTTRTLWAWGTNGLGQLGLGDIIARNTPTQVSTETDWSVIAAGFRYSLSIKTQGTLWAWGENNYGQLGDGTQTDRYTPKQIGTESDWSTIDAGNYHSFALKTTGILWIWGRGDSGELGLGDMINRNIPCRLGSPTPVSALIAIVIASFQINLSWTDNSINETGFKIERKITSTGYSLLATVGPNITFYSDEGLTPGTTYYYRIKTYNVFGESSYSNEVSVSPRIVAPSLLTLNVIPSTQINLSWQDNSPDESEFKIERKIRQDGMWIEIGTVSENITNYSDITATGFAPNTTYYYRVKAYNVFGESFYSNETWGCVSGDWFTISRNGYHVLGLKTIGTLWAWGKNNAGQLGLGDSGIDTFRTTPTLVTTETDWVVLAAGYNYSLALKSNPAGGRTLWTWGYNSNGQLGLNDTIGRNTPTQVTTETDWSIIDAGETHSLALKMQGTLWAWGNNEYGQLGLGDSGWDTKRTTPTQVITETDWSIVVAGQRHSLGIKTTGTLWTWGYNSSGQLGLNDTIGRNTPTQVTTETDWSIIDAGETHSLALKMQGTLWAWGWNGLGQLGIGNYTGNKKTPTQVTTETDWSIIAAGKYHSLGLKTMGTLWAWGENNYGQLGMGDLTNRNTPTLVTTQTDWSIIGAGGTHSLALKMQGTLWVWGDNQYGQLGLGDMSNRNIPTLVGE